ncbi:MAG: ComEC/Rec2 family competence protein [Bacteroidota bacterium]
MSPWSILPFVRITLAFISGILAAYYKGLHCWVAVVSLVLLLTVYLYIIINHSRPSFYQWSLWLGLIGLSCIFLSGYWCLLTNKECSAPEHLIHQADTIEAYVATAIEDAREKEQGVSITVALKQARIRSKWEKLQGRVSLHLPKPLSTELTYGDVLLVLGQPQAVASPRNPQEFDYKTFLSHDNIYHQHLVQQGAITKLDNVPPSYLQAFLLKLRKYCKAALAQHIKGNRERAIVLALVLGLKDELDLVTKVAYAGAGTMHVLAVSGLHVGILYWLLSVLLGRASNARCTGWLSSVIILTVLWLYACITGLAPSVLRATMMFSLVVMAKLLGRTSNIYNALAASAFLLLLWNPFLIFSVGFQLSYLAVLGIVYLQPKIYRWVSIDNFLFGQLWMWTSVSLAAQLAVAPISLYYFHQFPTYFLVANWVVVPAAFLILSLGFGVLLTSFWAGLSTLVAWILEQVTWLVNQFVLWISNLPFSLIEDIYLDTSSLLLLYTLFIALLIFFQKKKFNYLLVASGVALLFCVWSTKVLLRQQAQQGIIFYSISHHRVVAFIKGLNSTLCVDKGFKAHDKKYTYHVKPSQLAMGIRAGTSYSFVEAARAQGFPLQVWEGLQVGVWGQKKFIFIDKANLTWPRFASKVDIDFLVIEENTLPKLQLLLDQFDFDTLIIGSSNKKQRALQLKIEADQLNLNSHSLHQQGAFKISW